MFRATARSRPVVLSSPAAEEEGFWSRDYLIWQRHEPRSLLQQPQPNHTGHKNSETVSKTSLHNAHYLEGG
jgi:hypothetical protein